MANKVYKIVTDAIIARIEDSIKNGTALPWQKPWTAETVPINYISQKAYRGVNLLLLDGGEYLTWSQLCDLQKHTPSLKLRKGSKSHIVVFFSFQEVEKEQTANEKNAEQVRVPFLRYYKVFNARDVEGLELRRQPVSYEHDPHETAEQIANDYIARESVQLLFKNGDRACYSPASDTITVPEMWQYESRSEHYSTLFHEIVHSTGSTKRLNRLIKSAYFGSTEYSKEELIAEMGAAILCGHCGLDTAGSFNNSVAYLQGWLKALKDDVTLIVSASSRAQKAVDFVLEKNPAALHEQQESAE